MTEKKYKIAIVGKKEEIIGFSAVGVQIFPVSNIAKATEKLFELKKAKQDNNDENSAPLYAIVFVMEDIIKEIHADDMKKLTAGALPAIISLPGHKGATGYGETMVRKIVEKAVGTDIFAN